jgi:membrane protein implicated in regulation of membrane protease activity
VDAQGLSWWIWLVAGLVLMVMEALTPGGFFVIFFGAGAVIVGLIDLSGLNMPLVVQAALFVVTSLLATVLFRRPLLERFRDLTPRHKVDVIVGETAQALEEIPVNGFGKAELRGTAWTAHNIGDTPIARSARCRVERVDGLTLYIRG